MWIKTRVGLVVLAESMEIRVLKFPTSENWAIVAIGRRGPERQVRRLFRRVRIITNPLFLAAFPDRAGVQSEIGQALERIASAVLSGAPVCDLSTAGTSDAWGGAWRQVAWP